MLYRAVPLISWGMLILLGVGAAWLFLLDRPLWRLDRKALVFLVVSMAVGSNTVLAFLSTGCLTCRTFWDGLQPAVRTPLPGEARVVVVVKDPAFESPSKLRELAPPDLQVVQSSRAWEDFGIEMSPYFCFVDGATGEVRSEGAAMTWEQVASLLRDALLDEELAART